MLIEFGDAESLAGAAIRLRALGYRGLDAYTPYSTEIVRDALALEPSRLPRAVLLAALFGAGLAYAVEWYTNAHLYPLDVGGRPPHLPLAFVPIAFEMGVLAAAFAAFFGVLAAADLVKLWHPVFEVEGFESASIDRFWLSVDAAALGFDAGALREQVAAFHPGRHSLVGAPA